MTPLYYFNPTAELAAANGCVSYQPPLHLQRFEADLSCLPLAYSGSCSYIAVPDAVSPRLLDLWAEAGFELPRFVPIRELPDIAAGTVMHLHPWANSPTLRRIFPPYNAYEKKGIPHLSLPAWEPQCTALSSRETAIAVWQAMVARGLASYADIPRYCDTMSQLESAVGDLCPSVIKLNHTSSGRGLFFVQDALSRDDIYKLSKRVAQGCVVERLRDKRADFSVHFLHHNGCARYIGWSQMHNAANGRYHGSAVSHSDHVLVDGQRVAVAPIVEEYLHFYAQHLPETPYMQLQGGPVGIDMLLYMGDNNTLALHPCVEINARYTMGYVCLSLQRYLHPEAQGLFTIRHCANGAEKDIAQMQGLAPLMMLDGKIRSGCIPLTDYTHGAQFAAVLSVL